jgi:hypothetical protein
MVDVVAWPCCSKLIHKECLLIWREHSHLCIECGAEMEDLASLLCCPVIDHTKEITKAPQLTPMKRHQHWEGKCDLQAIELNKVFGTPEYPRLADRERQSAQEKKCDRQLEQAKDMTKTRAKASKNGGVFPGAVISIFADTREVSHPVGLLAIIIKTSAGGGVLPATEGTRPLSATLSVIHSIVPWSPPLSLSAVSKWDTPDATGTDTPSLVAMMLAMRPPQSKQNNATMLYKKRRTTNDENSDERDGSYRKFDDDIAYMLKQF